VFERASKKLGKNYLIVFWSSSLVD